MKQIRLLLAILLAIVGASSVKAQTIPFGIDPQTKYLTTDENTAVFQVYPMSDKDAEVNFSADALALNEPTMGAVFSRQSNGQTIPIEKVEKVAGSRNSFKVTFANEGAMDAYVQYYLRDDLVTQNGYRLKFPAGTFRSGVYVNGSPVSQNVYFVTLSEVSFIIDPLTKYLTTDDNTAVFQVYPASDKDAEVNFSADALALNEPTMGAVFSRQSNGQTIPIEKVEKVAGSRNSFKVTFANEGAMGTYVQYYLRDDLVTQNGYHLGFPAGTFQSGFNVNGSNLSLNVYFVTLSEVSFIIDPQTKYLTTDENTAVFQVYPASDKDAEVNFSADALALNVPTMGAVFSRQSNGQTIPIEKVEKVAGSRNSFKVTFANEGAMGAYVQNYLREDLVTQNGYHLGFPAGTFRSGVYVNGSPVSQNVYFVTPPEAYAVLSSDGTTLTFYYDAKKGIREGIKYAINFDEHTNPGWWDKDGITTVTFDASFANYDNLHYTCHMFEELGGLKNINGLEYLNTKNVINMEVMFSYCSALTYLDLSNFDVSKVTNMRNMFYGCENLETIFCAESANWNSVSNTSSMFSGCKKLSGKYAGGNFAWTNSNATDKTYAKVCKNGQNGYFTYIGNLDGQSVTLNGDGYATYSSSLPVDFTNASGYTAWKITGIEGETITFEQITGSVAAGTGVLLMGGANAQITINFSTYGDAHSDNMLVGFTTATSIGSGEYYGLSGNQFVNVNTGTVPAGKALLPIEGNTVKSLNLVFNDETGIIETQTVNAEQATGIFNLAGQRLEKPQRGINIVNGKKMLVK